MEFVDLSGDGRKQIILWTQVEGYARSLRIYKLENDKLYAVFRIDTNSDINLDLDADPPAIEVGIAKWIWDGEKFISSL